jgi:hypothetical protein
MLVIVNLGKALFMSPYIVSWYNANELSEMLASSILPCKIDANGGMFGMGDQEVSQNDHPRDIRILFTSRAIMEKRILPNMHNGILMPAQGISAH